MAQLSRRTFNELKRYDTVVIKENTPPGDFEIVEMQDIQNAERRGLLTSILKDGALADGFKVVGDGSSNAVLITPGTFLSSGERLILPDLQHPLVSGQFVFSMPIVTPVTNRTDLVYLEIRRETVTATQDPDLQDPLLGPTADRERTIYTLRVEEGGTTLPALPAGSTGQRLATIVRRGGDPLVQAEDVVDIREIAGLQDQLQPSNLIIVSESGGQFTDIQTALDSITGSSQSNPFTVLVEPGEYVSTVPITLDNPWVQLVGRNPQATTIKISPTAGVLTAYVVNADNVTIANLGLDITDSTPGDMVLLTQGASITTRIENCFLGEQFFAQNGTNVMKGVEVGSTSTIDLIGCRIFGQKVGAGISNPSGTATLKDCLVSCHVVDALTGSGTYNLDGCEVVTNERTLNILGALTARNCTFTTEDTKATSGISSNGVELGGLVTNTMLDCKIVSNIGRVDITDTSLIWTNVEILLPVFLGGGGSSRFEDCRIGGIDDTAADADFLHCEFVGADFAGLGGNLATVSPDTAGLAIFGGAAVNIFSCKSTADQFVKINGSNPRIHDCDIDVPTEFAVGINIQNGSKPKITHCSLYAGAFTTLNMINVQDVASEPVVAHCHFEKAPSGGVPANVITGIVGMTIQIGQNTKSVAFADLVVAGPTTEDIAV